MQTRCVESLWKAVLDVCGLLITEDHPIVRRECKKGSTISGVKDPTRRNPPRSRELQLQTETTTDLANLDDADAANTADNQQSPANGDGQSETSRELFGSDPVASQSNRTPIDTTQKKLPTFGQSGYPIAETKLPMGLPAGKI